MPNSLKCKIKHLRHNGTLTERECDRILKALEQESKTGKWIADVDKWGDIVTTVKGYRCDKCNTFNTDKDNYCPYCGAKMEEDAE